MSDSFVRSASDLTDDEIVAAMEGPQSAPGSYLHDPLEGQIVIATGRPVVGPQESFFDDVRKRYEKLAYPLCVPSQEIVV